MAYFKVAIFDDDLQDAIMIAAKSDNPGIKVIIEHQEHTLKSYLLLSIGQQDIGSIMNDEIVTKELANKTIMWLCNG